MIPDASEIVRRRWAVAIALRVCAIVPLSVGTGMLVWWLSEGIMDGDLLWMGYYGARIIAGGVQVGFALLFLAFAAPLSRLFVPIVKSLRCPNCRYEIAGLVQPGCPECGLELTEEFLGGHRSPKPSYSPEERRVMLVQTFVPILRIAAAPLLLWFLLASVSLWIAAINSVLAGPSNRPLLADELDWLSLFFAVILSLCSVVLLVSLTRTTRVATWLVGSTPPDRDHADTPGPA
ncbi:MAG: hypothetical protein AAGI17_04285 [Planctomycetota bacterium]